MNRFALRFMAAICASTLFVSCDQVDQPTYTQSVFRFVTVEQNSYGVSLNVDYTGESFTFNNFNTESDMTGFGARNGSRALASIEIKIVGDANLAQYNLLSLDTLDVKSLDLKPFQDTLGTYFDFANIRVDNQFVYPKLWTNGKYLNVAPYFYPKSVQNTSKPTFRLHPNRVSNDTLYLTMIVDSLVSDTRYSAENRFYCYDLSSMRNSTSNSEMTQRISGIFSKLDAIRQDSIYITVATCNTLETIDGNTESTFDGKSVTTKTVYCF